MTSNLKMQSESRKSLGSINQSLLMELSSDLGDACDCPSSSSALDLNGLNTAVPCGLNYLISVVIVAR